MSIHLQRKIDSIRQMVTVLAHNVEEAVAMAITAVENRDPALARRVIESDDKIDQMEIDVEEECLKALALEQPVAHDLRYVVSVLKVNNDLERIADMAVNIATQATFLADEAPVDVAGFLDGMTDQVKLMLQDSLQSLLLVDTAKAERVRTLDDRVDMMHRRMYEQVETAMRAEPSRIPQLMHLMNVSKNLERIADLATNISEDVVYMVRGDIVRHGRK